MTIYTRFNRDGSSSTGNVHPEIAESFLACLKRDLRRLRQTNGRAFLRRPYADLQEAEMIATNPESPPSASIVGVSVFPVVKGETNARMPMTAEQVREAIAKGDLIDLWTIKGFA